MRQKEHLGLRQERGGSGAPRGKWLPRLCHISCRCYQRCFHQDASKVFRRRNDRNCVKNGACCRQEKTRHVAVRRHDTLCVRGVFSLFLLEQRLAEFDDINYVGKTASIMGSATLGFPRRTERSRRNVDCPQDYSKHRPGLLPEKALRRRGAVSTREEKVVMLFCT